MLMDFRRPDARGLALHLQVSSACGRTNPTAQSGRARKTLGEGIPGGRGHLSWTEVPLPTLPAPRPSLRLGPSLGSGTNSVARGTSPSPRPLLPL